MIIQVENLKCGGCANSIKIGLHLLGNVHSVQIDKTTGTIELEGTIEREVVLEKLRSLGYPEVGHNTLLSKAKSYASCVYGKINEEAEV